MREDRNQVGAVVAFCSDFVRGDRQVEQEEQDEEAKRMKMKAAFDKCACPAATGESHGSAEQGRDKRYVV